MIRTGDGKSVCSKAWLECNLVKNYFVKKKKKHNGGAIFSACPFLTLVSFSTAYSPTHRRSRSWQGWSHSHHSVRTWTCTRATWHPWYGLSLSLSLSLAVLCFVQASCISTKNLLSEISSVWPHLPCRLFCILASFLSEILSDLNQAVPNHLADETQARQADTPPCHPLSFSFSSFFLSQNKKIKISFLCEQVTHTRSLPMPLRRSWASTRIVSKKQHGQRSRWRWPVVLRWPVMTKAMPGLSLSGMEYSISFLQSFLWNIKAFPRTFSLKWLEIVSSVICFQLRKSINICSKETNTLVEHCRIKIGSFRCSVIASTCVCVCVCVCGFFLFALCM